MATTDTQSLYSTRIASPTIDVVETSRLNFLQGMLTDERIQEIAQSLFGASTENPIPTTYLSFTEICSSLLVASLHLLQKIVNFFFGQEEIVRPLTRIENLEAQTLEMREQNNEVEKNLIRLSRLIQEDDAIRELYGKGSSSNAFALNPPTLDLSNPVDNISVENWRIESLRESYFRSWRTRLNIFCEQNPEFQSLLQERLHEEGFDTSQEGLSLASGSGSNEPFAETNHSSGD